MPKIRIHRGAAKRVRRIASGQLKRSGAFTSRLFTSKSTKQKHQLREARLVSRDDIERIKQLLAYKK